MSGFGWLTEAARKAGLPNADRLPATYDGRVQEAWESVTKITGASPWEVADAVARHLRVGVADLEDRDVSALRLIPESEARKRTVLALREEGRKLLLAVADPTDGAMLQDLEFVAGRYLEPLVAPGYELAALISSLYGDHNPVADYLAQQDLGTVTPILVGTLDQDASTSVRLDLQEDPTAKLVSLLFQEAIQLGASDLHLEPMAGGAVARFRVEGVLIKSRFMPRQVQTRAVSHVKAISGMDPTTRIRPQDGRARLYSGNATYDLRISTLPAGKGENMVVRILSGSGVNSLGDLAYREPEASQLRALFGRSAGIAILTGPTGSGKTTTLNGAIQELKSPEVDIHTVEDPVEYQIPGVVQVQVDEKQGLTFAAAIRSILRQDPDILLVGEIRDPETAEAAKQAALTGHLVLSTLHTQDAPSAIMRLKDLGIDPSYLAEILAGSAAQRLVRKLCTRCSTPVSDELAPLEARYEVVLGTRPPRRAVGCPECGDSGYRGRVPIAQVFTVTPAVADLITEGAPLAKIRLLAHEEGMRSLARSGVDLIQEGTTSVDELVRVLGESFWLELEYEKSRDVLTEDYHHRAANPPKEDPWAGFSQGPDKPEVLVVEEDELRRKRIARVLEEMRYGVFEARHADEARALMRDHPHIALMVVSLIEEGRSGREVLRDDYRALGGYTVPAVLIIPEGDQEVQQVLLANGAVDFLFAPVEEEDLKFRVSAAVRRHEMAHPNAS